ncbi:hypothetical protein EHI_093990 [Entamoeba histolytica HM-1:IMSS]|uniref:Uncharacterized protein n=2 Tax=Entamoeba histolytica TaxID=5759 RepID=C4LYJ0_ENTH1|nr:hypothetical protein EHI_093990 [Entamoeba histolytica HM-1:IMSS]EAL51886.1 hypothetical protein EHI_093990 [Entamoeba histolytica HM-1:IMSS]EMD48921.1 Hypothetical protein EHI5A_027210 [Entamoeba histolytica KU27]|eukprot:XP_657271.1 hypothetical protein EHI_093990 [Entamoeba histolytica HM-1:IMSS]
MLRFVLFLVVTFAKDSLVFTELKNEDGDAVGFISIEFDKCYYYGESSSSYFTHDGDKVIIKLYDGSSSCSRNNEEQTFDIHDDALKRYCQVSLDYDVENCTHRDNTIRAYYTGKCYKCNVGKNYYCNYNEENGYMWENVYQNNKCTSKETVEQISQWECDVCKNGFMFQCGSMSTTVISIIILLSLVL